MARTAVRRRARPRRPGAGDGEGGPADRAADVVAYHAPGTAAASPARSPRRTCATGQIEEALVYPVTTETTDHPGGYQGAIDEFYAECARRLAAHLDAAATWWCWPRATRSSTAPTCTCTSGSPTATRPRSCPA